MKILLLISLATMVSGCACTLSTTEKAGKEWIHEYSLDYNSDSMENIDFYEVSEPNRQAAIAELTSTPLIPITKEQALAYTDKTFADKNAKQFYLVRSIYGYRGSGGYEVKFDGKHLVIHHSSMGSCMLYNKSALVVALSTEPEQVFVSLNVAR